MSRAGSGNRKGKQDPGNLIHGDSQMTTLIRGHDWGSSALGPMEGWSDGLLCSVNLMLGCAFPSLLFWGQELVQFYNDGFAPLLADRHPSGLGMPGPEFWSDAWAIVGPHFESVMKDGVTVFHQNALVPIVRDGRLQNVRWTYSHSAVWGIDGAVGRGAEGA
jgi:hypothetical protein